MRRSDWLVSVDGSHTYRSRPSRKSRATQIRDQAPQILPETLHSATDVCCQLQPERRGDSPPGQLLDIPRATSLASTRRLPCPGHRSAETSNTMPVSSAPGSSATSAAWPHRQAKPGAVVRSTSTA